MNFGQLYGSPNGFIAADEQARQNLATVMTARRVQGEIDQQPAHKALLEAQANEATARADKLRSEAEQEAAMKLKIAEIAANADSEGKGPADLGEAFGGMGAEMGAGKLRTPTERAHFFAGELAKAGYVKKAMDIEAEAAQADTRQEQARERQLKQQQEIERTRALQVTDVAQGAAAILHGGMDQQAYNLWRAQAAQLPVIGGERWIDVSKLPQDVNQARPILEYLARDGIKANEQYELEQTAAADKALIDKRKAEESLARVRASTAQAQAGVYKERAAALKKAGAVGPAAKSEIAANKTSAQIEKDLVKLYPPLDPDQIKDSSLRELGRIYPVGGRYLQWTQHGWLEIPRKELPAFKNK